MQHIRPMAPAAHGFSIALTILSSTSRLEATGRAAQIRAPTALLITGSITCDNTSIKDYLLWTVSDFKFRNRLFHLRCGRNEKGILIVKVRLLGFVGMAAVLSFSALTSFNSAEADSSPESVAATNSNGALPTSASSDSGKGPIRADSDANRPPNAAAVIDGHVIPLDQVQTTCLRDFGPRVVDKMVQAYVIDREAEKRGIKISPQDVDAELDRLKKAVAPATIDQLLTAHHQTLVMLKDDIHQELERRLLLADKIKPTKMTRCRVIFVKFDDPKASGGVKIRSESAAIAIVQRIEKRLDAGDDFANLARKFSEDPNAASGGDVGVVYSGAHANDVLVSAALGLKKGEITKTPVRIFNGYYLIQAVSTSDDRSASENALYTDAEGIYRDQQAQFLIGAYLYDLIQKSDVVYYVHD